MEADNEREFPGLDSFGDQDVNTNGVTIDGFVAGGVDVERIKLLRGRCYGGWHGHDGMIAYV